MDRADNSISEKERQEKKQSILSLIPRSLSKHFPLRIISLLLFLLFLFSPLHAQDPVSPVTHWLATVDEPSQQIVLSWCPSDTPQTLGYHICSGNPCLDYDTVFGRLDTSYRCLDHSPLESHTYRLHVFDSAFNVSALTPAFGNMVLSADVPPCSPTVSVGWTSYEGMPGGLDHYSLMVLRQPMDTAFVLLRTVPPDGTLAHVFDMADSVTAVSLKVLAVGREEGMVSQSNVVSVQRLTVDTALFLRLLAVDYDSVLSRNLVSYSVDSSYRRQPYVLWRSIDGSPWDSLALLDPARGSFADFDVNPFDSLHCYRISVRDACGLNPRLSGERCVVVPDPVPPRWAIPNVVVPGSDANGVFLPRLQGLKGDLYELHIYNRSGLLVFSSTDPAEAWTPPASIPQGVYTYALRVRFNDNRIQSFVGTVLLIR